MADKPSRMTVDLSQYPDLVVIHLGMRVNAIRGVRTLLSYGPRIQAAVKAAPDGLLLHENLWYSVVPLHFGMRQYWRDFDSLERWAHDLPHKAWWRDYLRDRGGTGFWHETYFRDGAVESLYVDMPPSGLTKFAPVQAARGSLFSARRRLGLKAAAEPAPVVVTEEALYRP